MSNAKRPRTGARRIAPRELPPPTEPPPSSSSSGAADAGARATHKGIRWQRQPSGLIRWWDPDRNKWIPYRRGADAPPRPPGWEEVRTGGPATDKSQRAGWRTPYRLIPPVLISAIIIGVLVADHGRGKSQSDDVKAEAKASAALVGRCLHQDGSAGGHPEYSSKAVDCTDAKATVKVVRVLPGTGDATCPAGETGFSIPYPGVTRPHVECVVPVAGHR